MICLLYAITHKKISSRKNLLEEGTMNQYLAKSAQSVQEALNKAGLACKVVEFSSSTRTANDAALSIGCSVAQIAKSLIFKTKHTSKPILVLASGPNKVSEKQLEFYIGESIVKADADFVREITGFAIGGIPPFGHKNSIDLIFIDQDLVALDEVWAAAGTPNSVFCITSKDLVNITKGKVISIVNPVV